MALDPEEPLDHDGDVDEPEALDELEDLDVEAVVDEVPPERPLASAPGLGADLPEADVLDQWRDVDLDDEDR